MDCCVDSIKCEENGHGFPPVSPHDSTIYSHMIAGECSGYNSDEEGVSGLVLMLVDDNCNG